jgi:prepilin-type processing-associated H-X9-DG protein
LKSPQAGDARQDDYDIWLGTDVLDTWIPWSRHGSSNVLHLDGHVKSVNRTDGYLGMYPGGQVFRDARFYP